MRYVLHPCCVQRILASILAVMCLSYAIPQVPRLASASSAGGLEHEGVQMASDGTISLAADAPPPPAVETGYARFGYYLATPQVFATPSFDMRLSYAATVPAGSALKIDLRTSVDGQQWSPWEAELADGATLNLPHAVAMAQYRIRLYGNTLVDPAVHSIVIAPYAGAPHYHTLQDDAAPTFRIRATRLGMVGGRTANGHIIQPRDHFVALPSWRSLSSRNGNEYQVRITYNGRSTVAPVWDVGPWNTRDDYWSLPREGFPDLRRGWPQDHAAYFEGYNGGYAEKGYVRFPTGMDVADGIWWDKLGIHGDQAEVEVTFLWLGRDPQAAPPPPADILVDDDGSAFQLSEAIWHHGPDGCGAGGHSFWAPTTTSAQQSKHSARWQPQIPADGLYEVFVHIPVCASTYPITQQASYLIQHRDGPQTVVINQVQQTGWVSLGRFPFTTGSSGFIELRNLTADAEQTIRFDDAKWVFIPPS